LLLLDGQVHHDTHAIPMGNYVSAVGNYVSVSPSELGNYVSADTWPSAPCACSDAPTSPKPPDGPAGPWTGHSPSSASLHDLETAVSEAVSVPVAGPIER